MSNQEYYFVEVTTVGCFGLLVSYYCSELAWNISELKHACFLDADGNRKSTFRVPGARFSKDPVT